jgi:hypothetical protein
VTEMEVLKLEIRKHLNNLADDLANGAATDFPEYKYLTGMIAGLATAERELLDLLKRRDED